MKIINSWDFTESNIIATRIARVLGGVEGITHIELWSEDNLPFIEIVTNTVIKPAQVLAWGSMLNDSEQAEVYFHRLEAYATTFLLKSGFLTNQRENFEIDRMDDYGIPLVMLAQAWNADAILNDAEQLAEEKVIMEIFKRDK